MFSLIWLTFCACFVEVIVFVKLILVKTNGVASIFHAGKSVLIFGDAQFSKFPKGTYHSNTEVLGP